MARARKANAVQSKIACLLWGEQGTGKSTMSLQSAYLKRPDGKPFRVLYIDPESGSVDDYMENLIADGINVENIYIIYSQSLEEIRGYIRKATNNEPFYELDDDGNETDQVVLDADGEPFCPDMIVIDGTAVLYMTSQQGLINFSKKRAAVRAKKKEIIGDERLVSVENAGMEQKDWGTLKFKGQDLILDLTACGKHYIITAREKNETKTIEKNGTTMSVATGRKIPDSFSGVGYNVKTEIRMFRDPEDYETVCAQVIKDRTQVHQPGEIIEDPTLLDWQKIIDRTAKNEAHVIRNNLVESAKIEERLYTKSVEDFASDEPEKDAELSIEDKVAELLKRKNALSPAKKQQLKAILENAGLPIAFKNIKDVAVVDAIAAKFEEL